VSQPDDSPLAIDGGTPTFPAGPPRWPRPNESVQEALAAAYADGSWGRYSGPHSERLIELLCDMHGLRHAWLCSSGTIAVELALRGLKVGPGDEVILGGYDFPGNFRAVEAVGARPVLVDLAPRTWAIDLDEVEAAIGPQTKGIIASHLHGSLVAMRRLRELADARGLAIVEDACQVPGAIVEGKPAGAWGDCGILSFGGSKLLTAGRGGAIVTDRDDILQRIKVFSQRGNEAFPMSELQAAVLVPQIPRLAGANAQRLQAVHRLLAACGDVAGLESVAITAEADSASASYKLPWLLTGAADDQEGNAGQQLRQRFVAAIQAEGVAMDEGFRGFARRTSNRCRVVGELRNARRASAGTVILHHPVLLEPVETIERVARAIRKVAARVL
jgi:dTDP-4-amino-4,6-dideoxygalactose transaminase